MMEGKQMGKLIEGKGYFAKGLFCVEFSLVPSISSDKVVILFLVWEMLGEGTFIKEIYILL